jgi:hypothetical protein
MAKNAAFPTGEHVSLNTGTGVLSGTPLRIGKLNGVAETDSGDMTATVSAGSISVSFPSGGIGNQSGWASVSLVGGWNLPVTGGTTCAQGAPIFWQGGASPLTTVGVAALPAPAQSASATATTGGTLAAATYFYRITATNANGETTASNEVSQVTTGSTSTVTVNWTQVFGATGYKIYRSTASGAEVLIATVGAVGTYTDTGAAAGTATVPVLNTTATPVWGTALAAKTVTTDGNLFVLVQNSGL